MQFLLYIHHLLYSLILLFVPSLFVIVTIIMGKQIIEKPGASSVGVLICWLGIAVVAALDGVVLAKVLKR